MNLRIFSWKISTKLSFINLFVSLLIVGIFVTVIFAFTDIETLITSIVENDIAQTVECSQLGGELTSIFAELTTAILYGENSLIELKIEHLNQKISDLNHQNLYPQLQGTLHHFTQQLFRILQQSSALGTKAETIGRIEAELIDSVDSLHDQIHTCMYTLALKGGESTQLQALDNIQAKLTNYRSSFRHIIQENQLRFGSHRMKDQEQVEGELSVLAELDYFYLELQMLGLIEPEILEHGQTLLDVVTEYKEQILQLQNTVAEFQQQLIALNSSKESVLGMLQKKNEDLAQASGQLQGKMTRKIDLARIMVLVLAGTSVCILFIASYFAVKLVTPLTALAQTAKDIANGILVVPNDPQNKGRRKKTRQREDEIGHLSASFLTMNETLNRIISHVKTSTDSVASGSQQMSSCAEQLSQGANLQAESTEEASSSIEEIVASIEKNAENAWQTEQIASKVVEDAQESSQAMTETVSAMQHISKEVVMITEIAQQTRLLSLNATIEASRAQEHGKGFAVVAAEVRALAERSQHAAEKIHDLVHTSVASAENSGQMLTRLVQDIQKTACLVKEISFASQEQDTGVKQINQAIQKLDHVTQQNSATSQELSSMAEELANQAGHLQEIIAFFNTKNENSSEYTAQEAPNGQQHAIFPQKPSQMYQASFRDHDRDLSHDDQELPIELAEPSLQELDKQFERY